MKIELLLDATEFWTRMRRDLAEARHSAYVQTFTFEGDRVGTGLARALHRARTFPGRRQALEEGTRASTQPVEPHPT